MSEEIELRIFSVKRRFGESAEKMGQYSAAGVGGVTFFMDAKGGACCAAIFGDYNYYQCKNKGKHEYDGRLYCGKHLPPVAIAKSKERAYRMKAKIDADMARLRLIDAADRWKDRAVAALAEIAKGELSDPAGYAQMILDERPEAL